MRYKLLRVASNSEGWERPSGGRLNQKGVGDYVKEHGFGHEDWNFNFSMADGGQMLGYTVARPGQNTLGDEFGIILATFENNEWRAAGYYDGAKYIAETELSVPDTNVRQMAADVFELARAGQALPPYEAMTLTQIERIVRKSFAHFCWLTPSTDVHPFQQPFAIPKEIFNPGKQRMKTPFNLSESQFFEITSLGKRALPDKPDQGIEEGSRRLRIHKVSERNPQLVAKFKASLGNFACAVCGFDFFRKYGSLGENFIECHHIRPVAKMKPGDRTRLADLRAVCSNCHRMLHRSMPLMEIEQLRTVVKTSAGVHG